MTRTDGKMYRVLGLEESIFVKMTILPKAIYRFSAIPSKLPMAFFTELERKIFNCVETQKTLKTKAILRKKNGAQGFRLPDFRLYYKAIVLRTVWYWHKNKYRSMEEDRKHRNNPTHLWSIYDKEDKTIQWRKDSLFNKWCWENWRAACKIMKLEHSLTPYTKINSKWIKDLNVRPDSIKLLEENIGRTLFDINRSNIFFDPSPREMEIKTKITNRT